MPPLTHKEIATGLGSAPGWALRGLSIRRTFTFPSFPGAVAFVNRIAREAEKQDHHPDINIRWNKVALAFSTHSEGGVTRKDLRAARRANALFGPVRKR